LRLMVLQQTHRWCGFRIAQSGRYADHPETHANAQIACRCSLRAKWCDYGHGDALPQVVDAPIQIQDSLA